MNFSEYQVWASTATAMSMLLENNGGNQIVAHRDGIERGWWNPNYACGFGWIEDSIERK